MVTTQSTMEVRIERIGERLSEMITLEHHRVAGDLLASRERSNTERVTRARSGQGG